MKRTILATAVAAVVAGTMALGCSKAKQENEAAAQPSRPAAGAQPGPMTGGTTPMTPDRMADQKMQDAGAQMKAAGDNAKGAVGSASDTMKAEADKVKGNMPSTMPSMPTMK